MWPRLPNARCGHAPTIVGDQTPFDVVVGQIRRTLFPWFGRRAITWNGLVDLLGYYGLIYAPWGAATGDDAYTIPFHGRMVIQCAHHLTSIYRRYSILHELGHNVLHPQDVKHGDGLDHRARTSPEMEHDADRFATLATFGIANFIDCAPSRAGDVLDIRYWQHGTDTIQHRLVTRFRTGTLATRWGIA